MWKKTSVFLLFFGLFLASPAASAQDGGGGVDGGLPDGGGGDGDGGTSPLDYPDEVRAPVHFEYTDALMEDVCGYELDSGWVPQSSPIQVRFHFRIGCGYFMEMDGYAVLDWPPRPGPNLHFRGINRGGRYELDYSILLSAKVKLYLDLGGGNIIDEEFDLPWIPDFNVGVFASQRFTPFLLQGNPERPLVVEDQIPHTLLFKYDLVDLLEMTGTIPPQDIVQAWLEVYLDGYVGSRFEGRRIVVDVGEQNTEFPIPDLVFVEEGQVERLPISPEEQEFGMRQAIYEGAVTHYAGISFYPEITIEILGADVFHLDVFEIPIPIDDQEDYWVFDPVFFEFSLPDIAAPTKVLVPPADIGSDSMVHVQIMNTGGKLLRGEALVDPPFHVPYPNKFEVEPGANVMLPVYFTPTTIGPQRKFITLYSNDPDESPLVVTVESYGCAEDGDCAIPADMIRVCENPSSGCGCRAGSGRSADLPLAVVLLGLVGLALWTVRHRKRHRRCTARSRGGRHTGPR